VIGCLISLIIVVIVAVIVIYVLEQVIGAFLALPPPVWMLVRLPIGLLVLLYALNCLSASGVLQGFGGWGGPYGYRH
jgi:hypothetical protein